MELTVLIDNTAGGKCRAEHGFSLLIEKEGIKILFDAGYSDAFIYNAGLLGKDLFNGINAVVLSHGHWDHGNGLRFISGHKLITHPDAFMRRYRKEDNSYIGLAFHEGQLENRYDLHLSKKPYEIIKDIFYLGEIPRCNDFEAKTTTFFDEKGEPDFVPDDSGLAMVHHDELIVITGCAHAGVVNTVEYAKKVTGINKVHSVIGGFHLKYDDDTTIRTIDYLKQLQLKQIYPCHCTELPALTLFYDTFKMKQVKSGMKIIIE